MNDVVNMRWEERVEMVSGVRDRVVGKRGVWEVVGRDVGSGVGGRKEGVGGGGDMVKIVVVVRVVDVR